MFNEAFLKTFNTLKFFLDFVKKNIKEIGNLYFEYKMHKIDKWNQEVSYVEINFLMLNNIINIHKHLKKEDQNLIGNMLEKRVLWFPKRFLILKNEKTLSFEEIQKYNKALSIYENTTLVDLIKIKSKLLKKENQHLKDFAAFTETKFLIKTELKEYTVSDLILTKFYEQIKIERLKFELYSGIDLDRKVLNLLCKNIVQTQSVNQLKVKSGYDIKGPYLAKDLAQKIKLGEEKKRKKDKFHITILSDNLQIREWNIGDLIKAKTKEDRLKIMKNLKLNIEFGYSFEEGFSSYIYEMRRNLLLGLDKSFIENLSRNAAYPVYVNLDYKFKSDFLVDLSKASIINELIDKTAKFNCQLEELKDCNLSFLNSFLEDDYAVIFFLIIISFHYFLSTGKISLYLFDIFGNLVDFCFTTFKKRKDKKVKFYKYMSLFNSRNLGLVESIDRKNFLEVMQENLIKKKLFFFKRTFDESGIITKKKKNNYFFSFYDILLRKPKYIKTNIREVKDKDSFYAYSKAFDFDKKISNIEILDSFKKEDEQGIKHMHYLLDLKKFKRNVERFYVQNFSTLNKYRQYYNSDGYGAYRYDNLGKKEKNRDLERLDSNVYNLDMNIYERKFKINVLIPKLWNNFSALYYSLSDLGSICFVYFLLFLIPFEVEKHTEMFIGGDRFIILADCVLYSLILGLIHMYLEYSFYNYLDMYNEGQERKKEDRSDAFLIKYRGEKRSFGFALRLKEGRINVFICFLLFIISILIIKGEVLFNKKENIYYIFIYENIINIFFFILIGWICYKLITKLKIHYILILLLIITIILSLCLIDKNKSINDINIILLIYFDLLSFLDVIFFGFILEFVEFGNDNLINFHEYVKNSRLGGFDAFIVLVVEKMVNFLHIEINAGVVTVLHDYKKNLYPFLEGLCFIFYIAYFVLIKGIFVLFILYILIKVMPLVLYKRKTNTMNEIKDEIYENLNVFTYSKINKVFYRLLVKDMLNLKEIKSHVSYMYTYLRNRFG